MLQLPLCSASPRGAGRQEKLLDEHSWVAHIHGWRPDDADFSISLYAGLRWEQRGRWMFTRYVDEPRLIAEIPSLAASPSETLTKLGSELSARCGVLYDTAWLNLSRGHDDTSAWHRDRTSCKRDLCLPALSLGETRRFLLLQRGGSRSVNFGSSLRATKE